MPFVNKEYCSLLMFNQLLRILEDKNGKFRVLNLIKVSSFTFHIFCFRDFSSRGGKNGFQASEKAAWHPEREF